MRVLVLHQAVAEEATVDEQDVLAQLEAVTAALQRQGHAVKVFACTLNLAELREYIAHIQPELVFNLVESLNGSDQLITVVPTLLESLRIPYTGVPASSIFLTTNKLLAKAAYARLGIPTLPWWEEAHGNLADCLQNDAVFSLSWPGRWIRKPVWEHASFGMTDEAVFQCDSPGAVAEATRYWSKQLQRPCLAEPYIHGRESNLSLLGSTEGVQVMPPAEIQFLNYAENKPRIVGYAAKWSEQAPEYGGTPRTFDFPESDHPLLSSLSNIAQHCWQALQLRGYARVDFRVDEQNRPWVLEINANPCIAPWSGFTAAVEQAGLTYDTAIARIVEQAL